MPIIEKHTPGEFCWVELGTTDPAAAKAFYGKLFGWGAQDNPVTDTDFYTLFQLEGRDAAGMYRMSAEQLSQGVPPHWMLYVCVESADETAARAEQLGGSVVAKPFDVFDIGRMALLRDPTRAMVSLWQPKKHIGTGINQIPGTLCWSELATRDTGRAAEFYTGLFDWGTKTNQMGPETYTEWINQGTPIGGMMEIQPQWGDVPPYWMPYFLVTNCDSSAATATGSGGTLILPPTDIPNVGRFAVVKDPQGAVFSIIHLTAPAA